MTCVRFLRIAAALILLLPLITMQAGAQQIAFTWDDLPAHSALPRGVTRLQIIHDIIAAMRAAGLPPAYGFVNGVRLEEEPGTAGVLEAWRAAGFPLGNHGWSHMNLNQHSAAEFEADVEKDEPLLEKQMNGQDWHWLRYPNLAEGDTPEKRSEVRAFLAKKGYRIAAVTMSFGDYLWNAPYAKCVADNDQPAIHELEQTYLAAAAADADYRRALSRAAYGRDIPYVLLMHVGALDARLLPQLLAMYKQKGFQFITLEQAQRDPFYRVDMDLNISGPPASPATMVVLAGNHAPQAPKQPDFSAVCQ